MAGLRISSAMHGYDGCATWVACCTYGHNGAIRVAGHGRRAIRAQRDELGAWIDMCGHDKLERKFSSVRLKKEPAPHPCPSLGPGLLFDRDPTLTPSCGLVRRSGV